MHVYFWTSTLTGLILLIPSVLSQAALWQRKEYRLDRMRAYLFSPEGSLFYKPWLFFAYLFIGFGWIFSFNDGNSAADASGWISLLFFIWYRISRMAYRGISRPHWTLKGITLTATIIVAVLLYLQVTFIPDYLPALQMATLFLFLPFLSALSAALVNIPFAIKKQQIIEQASAWRKQQKDMTVLGITGSFGKTSTKHFLLHMLEETSYRVAATKKHRNSYIGVAEDMLLHKKHPPHFYIAEMGAYRKGEIAEIATMVQPKVGIITAIGKQHMDLFGTQENILAAKWELAQALPADGTLVVNDDDALLQKAVVDFKGHIIRYSITHQTDVWADTIVVEPTSLFFRLHMAEASYSIRVPLASTGLLSSLLAAVAGACVLGVPYTHIVEQLKTIRSFPRTMEIKSNSHFTYVIDDSYSGGLEASLNAIEHITRFSGTDKRIVFVPVIELGSAGVSAHQQIGDALATSGARIYIYGNEYREVLSQSFIGQKDKVKWYTNPVKLIEDVSSNVTPQTVLLLEGRVPILLRRTLYSHSPLV